MKNLHWAIWASDKIITVNSDERLLWPVDIQVKHCENEEEAILRAKEIIKRQYYKLRSVLECDCAQHNLQYRKTLEVSKETAKTLKKMLSKEDDASS